MTSSKKAYKVYDHPYRDKMIKRLCIEIFGIEEKNIPKDINQRLCFITYQEIVKPLVCMEFRQNITTGILGVKYGLTARVIDRMVKY